MKYLYILHTRVLMKLNAHFELLYYSLNPPTNCLGETWVREGSLHKCGLIEEDWPSEGKETVFNLIIE